MRGWWALLPCVLGCNGGSNAPDAGDAGAADVNAPVDADAFESGASLTGAQSFAVAFAWMNPAEPAKQCNADAVGGAYAATAIDLFETDVSQTACSDAGLGAAYGRVIGIEIATAQYAGKHALTQPLTAGTYVIGNENIPDEDLCTLPTNTSAILQVLQSGDAGAYAATWNATSGSVIVTDITSTHVVGTFSVQLGDVNGGPADGGALSGSFSAAACP